MIVLFYLAKYEIDIVPYDVSVRAQFRWKLNCTEFPLHVYILRNQLRIFRGKISPGKWRITKSIGERMFGQTSNNDVNPTTAKIRSSDLKLESLRYQLPTPYSTFDFLRWHRSIFLVTKAFSLPLFKRVFTYASNPSVSDSGFLSSLRFDRALRPQNISNFPSSQRKSQVRVSTSTLKFYPLQQPSFKL